MNRFLNWSRLHAIPPLTERLQHNLRNLSQEVHWVSKMRAAHHRRSEEAEIRDILKRTILPVDRLRIGSTVAILSLEVG